MQKVFYIFVFITVLLAGCATQSPTPAKASPAKVTPAVSTTDELDPAIREASNYLNTKIPKGRKAVFLNITSDYPDLSEYILSLLSENAVNDGIFSVVDRVQLDAIRTEMNFQLSGEVDDNSAQEIGKMLGAQTIVSGTVNKIGSLYRMQVKAIEVQTAGVQGQWSKTVSGSGGIVIALTENQRSASGSGSSSPATAAGKPASGSTGTSGSVQVQSAAAAPVAPLPSTPRGQNVITVEGGATLTEKLKWLEENAASNTEYVIEVTANETITPKSILFQGKRNVTVRLTGKGGEKTLKLQENGALFTIGLGVTLILDNGITLLGRDKNNAALIVIDNGGILTMKTGAIVMGNTNSDGGSSRGGGIFLKGGSTFTMDGGEIYGNNHSFGGGLYVDPSGTFTMTGGEISGNTATNGDGGGVYLGGTFTMIGGEIFGNIAAGSSYGGGGGVNVSQVGIFTKSGGTIYGYTAADNKSNRFTNANSSGHAVKKFNSVKRDTTAGPSVRLDSSKSGAAGGWED